MIIWMKVKMDVKMSLCLVCFIRTEPDLRWSDELQWNNFWLITYNFWLHFSGARYKAYYKLLMDPVKEFIFLPSEQGTLW